MLAQPRRNETMNGRGSKLLNGYATALDRKLYEETPKAVFAALAVSALTLGGDYIDEANQRVMDEWWTLHDNGIVPQKPPFPRSVAQAA
jgi:hypothetical protein